MPECVPFYVSIALLLFCVRMRDKKVVNEKEDESNNLCETEISLKLAMVC